MRERVDAYVFLTSDARAQMQMLSLLITSDLLPGIAQTASSPFSTRQRALQGLAARSNDGMSAGGGGGGQFNNSQSRGRGRHEDMLRDQQQQQQVRGGILGRRWALLHENGDLFHIQC